MQCPTCNVDLTMADRQGIEIDYCPKCRGVWLDRGELDKIIERTAVEMNPAPRAAAAPASAPPQAYREPQPYREQRRYDNDDDERRYDPRYKGKYPHKRKSMLSELFDFD